VIQPSSARCERVERHLTALVENKNGQKRSKRS
jgi:hypothetical protein